MRKSFKIGIVGIGLVGKEVMNYFLEKGFERGKNLFCYDQDPKKNFFDDVCKADIIFICVPTPSNPDGSCNTSIIESVIKKFSKTDSKKSKKIFVIKSTVEPATTLRLEKKYQCPVLFNPEFLTESTSRQDFLKPDRQIVSHTANLEFAQTILKLLPKADFVSPYLAGNPGIKMDINSSEAEMGKYGANVFGTMKVSFANILADFCSGLEKVFQKEGIKTKVNYSNVKQIMANDKRIGHFWLDIFHGNYRGFAGYCFPKDLNAFIAFGRKLEQGLAKNDKDKHLISKGLAFLEAMRDYNIALLKSQNLDLKEVSVHNHEIKIKSKNARKK